MSTKNVRLGASHLAIKKFNIKDMCDYATFSMIAKRESGISFLIMPIAMPIAMPKTRKSR